MDITELNDALMNRNSVQNTRLELQNTLASRRQELAKLTPLDPETIPLPGFAPIAKESYLQRHLALNLARAQESMARAQAGITRSSALPTLTFNADYGYQQKDGEHLDPDSYSVGLRLSLPFSVTATAATEEKRAQALQRELEASQALLEAEATYTQTQTTIANLQERIGVLEENIRLYEKLISVAEAGVKSGYRNAYDLQTLQNTRAVDRLEIRLSELAIRIEQARLFYALIDPDKELL